MRWFSESAAIAIAVFMFSPFLRLYGLTQREEQHPCRVASHPCQTPAGGREAGWGSGNGQSSRSGGAGALWRRIGVCCVAATVCLWSVGSGDVALAQEPAAEIGQPPSPDVSMKAYRAVDDWVRGWKVGDEGVSPCVAASVTLRMDGEVLGRGVAMGERCLAAATSQAMAEAEPKLGAPRDALYQDTLRDLAKRITMSVQLAGELIPVVIKDVADAEAAVAPGLEGVGARLGDRVMVMFPERMLTMGTEPGPALASLVAKLGDDAALAVVPLGILAKEQGAVYYRFKVSHLAQMKAGDSPRFLSRCGRVVGLGAMDVAELRRWADELAASLLARRGGGKSGSLQAGGLNPMRGQFDEAAEPVVQLTCLSALQAYSARLDERKRSEVLAVKKAVLTDLLTDGDLRDRVLKDVAAAALVWANLAGDIFDEDESLPQDVDESFKEVCWSVVRSAFAADQGFSAKVSSTARGMVCWGMLIPAFADVPNTTTARAAITRAYSDVGAAGLAGLMPWLGQSDLVLSAIEFRLTRPEDERLDVRQYYYKAPLAAAVVLREMRSQLWQHQFQPEGLAPDQQDLSGGIVFTTVNHSMPTWQMARPLAFVATMLGDPRLTEEKEIPEELTRLLASLRFLRQLTVRESECFMYRNPDKAIGGVRSSLWDQRMPPEATAMTLMAVCETLRSLEEIEKRNADKQPGK